MCERGVDLEHLWWWFAIMFYTAGRARITNHLVLIDELQKELFLTLFTESSSMNFYRWRRRAPPASVRESHRHQFVQQLIASVGQPVQHDCCISGGETHHPWISPLLDRWQTWIHSSLLLFSPSNVTTYLHEISLFLFVYSDLMRVHTCHFTFSQASMKRKWKYPFVCTRAHWH